MHVSYPKPAVCPVSVFVRGPTVADFLQFYCFGDLGFVLRCARFPADFGLEQSVNQSGLSQPTLAWKYKKQVLVITQTIYIFLFLLTKNKRVLLQSEKN